MALSDHHLAVKRDEYFEKLIHLVELEEAEEIEQFRLAFVNKTPEERELTGKALLRLSIKDVHFSPAGHRLVTFEYADQRPLPIFTLDTGDVVSLARDDRDLWDLPTGTVYERDGSSITVAFAMLRDEWLDESRVFELNRSGNRATYKRTYEALDLVKEARHSHSAVLRDISFGIKPAATNDPIKIESLKFFNSGLNQWQKEAVRKSLEAARVSLVHGPPGTGKTTVLVEIIRQAILEGKSVFATAPSNTACDNLLESLVKQGVSALRMGHPARIMNHLRKHTLDFKTAVHPQAKDVDAIDKEIGLLFKKLDRFSERRSLSRDERSEIFDCIKSLKREKREIGRRILAHVIMDSPVVVGTHSSAADRLLERREFDLVVIDEATQATEPSTWIAIRRTPKIVLAGDHFQLPPTVRSKKAEEKGLGVTLFERYHRILGKDFVTLLQKQYRMHEDIMNFSSREFYDGKLVADKSVKGHLLADLKPVKKNTATCEAFLFIDTAGRGFEEKLEPGSESRYNADEAGLVLAQLKLHLDYGVSPKDIAVISPYSAQVRLMVSKTPDALIEIDSVDGFQGREKELVIVSLVRSNVTGEMGFLTDTRRMNVAMTRARRKLIVVGDSATVATIPFYRDFIQYAEKIGAYRSSWEDAG